MSKMPHARTYLPRAARTPDTPPTRYRLSSILCATLFASLGCSGSEPPASHVVVTLAGDADVMQQVVHLEASVYASDASRSDKPVARHAFSLPASTPLSFGIAPGRGDRFLLVVEGYASGDTRARPLIERKVRGHFVDARTLQLDVFLASECLGLTSPCNSLQNTCRSEARACAPIEDAPMREVVPGEERALDPPARPPVSEACRRSACPLPEYPCVATSASEHVCLGQFADWPMPDSSPGAAHAPSYDLEAPGVVRDRVTGLTWQREAPAAYPGCTGTRQTEPVQGSACTWDEAKVYCHQLALGGLPWRLPSKIELESIIDPMASSRAIASQTFPGCDEYVWTTSRFMAGRTDPEMSMWLIDAQTGVSRQSNVGTAACVRCVTGYPAASSTPGERYAVDGDLVRDARTGLHWKRGVSEPLPSVEAAGAYCSALGSGFRLPGYKELMTLVDPAREYPSIHPIFHDAPPTFYWSSRGRVPGGSGIRLVHFSLGFSHAEGHVPDVAFHDGTPPRARCVR